MKMTFRQRWDIVIYFDYAATSPVDEDVMDAYVQTTKELWGNTSSLHRFGLRSNERLHQCYKEIHRALNLENRKIIFTSGSTEANNLGFFGVVNASNARRKNIITTKIEHPAVLEICRHLEETGVSLTYLSVDESGRINLAELENAIDKDTVLVSVMWVNNIIGTIEPIGEIAKIVKKHPKCKLLVDAVQGLTKVEPDFDWNDIDMFTLSSHKIYGPKGTGALIYRADIDLSHHLFGSKQQYGIKPGTVDLPGAVATTMAITKYTNLLREHHAFVMEKYMFLRSELEKNPKIWINSPKMNFSPFIFNISIPTIKGEVLVRTLEDQDIMVSTGAACSSKEKRLEKTVFETTSDEQRAMTSIRISLSHHTTMEEVEKLLSALSAITKG